MLTISTDVANGVCAQYLADGIVCPINLQPGLFTVMAFDHNPSSATAQHFFHGTSMTLIQNLFTHSANEVEMCTSATAHISFASDNRIISKLPVSYTYVKSSTVAFSLSAVPVVTNLIKTMMNGPHTPTVVDSDAA